MWVNVSNLGKGVLKLLGVDEDIVSMYRFKGIGGGGSGVLEFWWLWKVKGKCIFYFILLLVFFFGVI